MRHESLVIFLEKIGIVARVMFLLPIFGETYGKMYTKIKGYELDFKKTECGEL